MSPAQRAARGCHREVTERRFAAPRAPCQSVPWLRVPGRGRPRDEARTRIAGTAVFVLAVGARLGGVGARRGSVFLGPVCSSPFFVAFGSCPFVTVCLLYGLE